MKLINSEIKAAKPKNKRYSLPDGNGLLLWILPNGKKTWRYRYYFHGKEKMLSLGGYPAISLKKAREQLSVFKELKAQGVDPSQFRQEQKHKTITANNFEAVARQWWENWKHNKTERYARVTLHLLKKDIFPVLGVTAVNDLTAANVVMVAKKIEGRNASEVARRALNLISQVMRYAVANGLAERNPAADIRPIDILKPVTTKHRPRVEEKELPELMRKIRDYPGEPLTVLALQLLARVFVRPIELVSAQWKEIDLENKVWRIPPARMKMKTPHIIPLSDPAIALLKQIRIFSPGNGWIFPNRNSDARHMSANTPLKTLHRLGYKGKMTAHGFRGIASTVLHENAFNHEHIELQLAHTKKDTVSAAYDHSKHLKERREMLNWWGNYLEKITK